MFFNTNYIHEKLASVIGMFVSVFISTAGSIVEKIIVGTITGILIGVGLKLITWLKDIIVKRFEKIEKKIAKIEDKL